MSKTLLRAAGFPSAASGKLAQDIGVQGIGSELSMLGEKKVRLRHFRRDRISNSNVAIDNRDCYRAPSLRKRLYGRAGRVLYIHMEGLEQSYRHVSDDGWTVDFEQVDSF